MKPKIQILPYQTIHQNEIDNMMASIALEFNEPIFTEKSNKIIDVYLNSNSKFWVALANDTVLGTVGVVELTNGNIMLKSMFVDKMYRGHGISNLLLVTVIDWAIQNNYTQIYLGTMTQFTAGQRFYEKNGFRQCNKTELPTDFTINSLDTIFYTKSLM
jgi:N-acetylglutamate synthase-like GNAT family acetyltransferase